MPVKIRLARRGRKKQPYYHIVVADARSPRDGKFIDNIGFYNPMTVPATIDLDSDKAYEWLSKGAQPTHTARAIMKFKGVYFKKHLLRGVEKGALTQEQADKMYQEWIDSKESKVQARREETKKKKEEFYKMLSGEIKPPKKVAATDSAEAFRETEETAAESTDAPADSGTEAVTAEAPVAEAPVAEAPAAEVANVEEAKKVEETVDTPAAEVVKEEAVAETEEAVEASAEEE